MYISRYKLSFQFRENPQIAMKLINRFAELSMDSGLTDSEQMNLLMMFTDMGGIDRVKAIALHEVKYLTCVFATKY